MYHPECLPDLGSHAESNLVRTWMGEESTGYKKKGDGRDGEDYKDSQSNQSICPELSMFQHSDASETVE